MGAWDNLRRQTAVTRSGPVLSDGNKTLGAGGSRHMEEGSCREATTRRVLGSARSPPWSWPVPRHAVVATLRAAVTATSAACKIAFFGALTGAAAGLGINIKQRRGKLAVEQYNEENPDCKVDLHEVDSRAARTRRRAWPSRLVDDDKIIGIIGPAFSGESEAANPIFDEAGLPIITAVRDRNRAWASRAGRSSTGRSATTPRRARRPATTSRTC